MIKFRKTGYSFMSWNMDKIKANLEGSYSKEQVMAAANVVAAAASSGMGALFGPGTDKEAAGQTSGVKPEFFNLNSSVSPLRQPDQEGPGPCAAASWV
ncbi:cytochrome c [Accumulibacter sp.]|uniref:cytochrome c n=1 Tax=Accumulibacter sp. TaxID=2053492 RepID=UPI0025C61331|nr:cytochrome c [Accumulibacter sp.]